MKKEEIIKLLKNYEEETEVNLFIKVYDLTGYHTVEIGIEAIDREGIHASIV